MNDSNLGRIAVVVPVYRCRDTILAVLRDVGPEVSRIFVVDDGCPDGTGALVRDTCPDPRVEVVFHERNQGVGGATVTGFKRALDAGFDVAVKLDGDGQMDAREIPRLVRPLLDGEADYAKGNRFFDLEGLRAMPRVRLVGNAVLSFIAKASAGYWQLMDPTNGFVAIHRAALALLPLEKLDRRYFFESDLLFRLNTIRAVVVEVPMPARYGRERSHLSVSRSVPEFAAKHTGRFLKRLIYSYLVRDFSIATLELFFGIALLGGGTAFGAYHWIKNARAGVMTPTGTVMLAVLPVILGFQLILQFLSYDVQPRWNRPVQRR